MRCIYRIDINDRYYIGSTINFEERKRIHLVKLKNQNHPNKFLQNLYNKYGENSFKFLIVELLEDSVNPLEIEQPYLDKHFGQEHCVNLSPIAGGGQLYIPTEETIKKGIETKKRTGKWGKNPYPKEAIAANTGSKRSKEFCDRMSVWKKEEYKNNSEQLKKLRDASDKGRENRWKNAAKPFILIKNDKEYGPFNYQFEVVDAGLMSNVSISQLFLGKKKIAKGYQIKFTDSLQ